MKKCMILILALLLSLAACAFAEEAAGKEADLFDLWNYGGESMTWVATGVPVTDGVLLTSAAALPENTDQLAVSDGKTVWEVKAVLPDSSGLLATVFYETEGKPARYGSYALLPYGHTAEAGNCTIRSGDDLGSRINSRILSADSITRKDNRCLLLSLDRSVPLGSAVLTAEGELAGIVVAYYAEGENRVLAMPPEEMARCMTEATSLLANLPGWGNPAEGFRVTRDKNEVTIDWKDMTLPEKGENETLYLIVLDTGNNYLNYYPAEVEERTIQLLLTPGRCYVTGIAATENIPDRIPEQFDVILLPEAKKLTEHRFQSVVCAIAEMPENAGENTEPVPVKEVTEELLRSGRAYFFSTSSYEVEETLDDQTLLVTLTDPVGVNYAYESRWIYGPEYMNEDTWYLSLTEIGLTSSLDQNGYPAGEYRMAFYVNGELGDSFTFELK